MDNPNPSEDELKIVGKAIAAYLDSNSNFHMRSRKVGHSWPCGIWDTKPGNGIGDKLLLHGVIPRNLLLIKRIEKHGKETLRDPEGDQ